MNTSQTLELRRVRLFKNGKNQAVRIPREFELRGEEATIHRDSKGRLVLESIQRKDLLAVLATLDPLSDEDALPEIEKLPVTPVDF